MLLFSNVNPDEAAYLFENFKILEQMKSYKAFSASGSKDATEVRSIAHCTGLKGRSCKKISC